MLGKFIYLYLITSIFLIITIRYGYRYMATYIGAILILFFVINLKKYWENLKKYKCILIITLIFIIFLIGQFALVNINEKGYIIHKIIPYGVFIVFLMQTKLQKEKMIKSFFYCMLAATFFALVLNMLQIDYLELGNDLRYYTKQLDLSIYGEKRLSGLFSHKSRFGFLLCMALMVGLNLKIKSIYKIVTTAFLFIAMIYANTKTFLIAFMLLVIIKLIFWIVDKYSINFKNFSVKKHLVKTLVGVFVLGLVGLVLIYNISLTRDITSLGSRTEIWGYAIEYIMKVPQGTVRLPADLVFNNISYYNNAHSTFLNEVIESGIIGGLIYLTYVVIILFSIEDRYYKLSFFSLLMFSQMDSVIYNEVTYIFFPIFALMIDKNRKIDCKGYDIELTDKQEDIL